MNPTREAADANLVLTLEEIANLAEQEGKPADTLMNVVALIASALQDRRLLGLSAGAGPVEPGAGRHARPASAIVSARLRMPLHEGLSGLVAEQVASRWPWPTRASIRATNTSRNRAKRSTTPSWACR